MSGNRRVPPTSRKGTAGAPTVAVKPPAQAWMYAQTAPTTLTSGSHRPTFHSPPRRNAVGRSAGVAGTFCPQRSADTPECARDPGRVATDEVEHDAEVRASIGEEHQLNRPSVEPAFGIAGQPGMQRLPARSCLGRRLGDPRPSSITANTA